MNYLVVFITLQVNVAANFPGNKGKKKKDCKTKSTFNMKLVTTVVYMSHTKAKQPMPRTRHKANAITL